MRWVMPGLVVWGLATVGYGVAMRQGWAPRDPALLALLVGLLLVGCVVQAGRLLLEARRGRASRASPLLAALSLAGLVMSLGVGLWNWLTGIEGALLLNEGDSMPLLATSHFATLDVGPLARQAELQGAVELTKVVLTPGGPEGFSPEAHVRLVMPGQPPSPAVVSLREASPLGAFLVLQGSFGFSPRIVITRDGATVFDERVPFTTAFDGPRSLRFARDFNIGKEQLEVRGTVDLASLDEEMKGHATLVLDVSRAGQALGQGTLTPGQFADLPSGYRVGFVGLSRWSELIVTSPRPRTAMLSGFVVALAGLVGWLVARVLERRAAR